jgi:para-aminobenzoate synthetase
MKEESLAGYRRGCKSPADGSVKEVDACWAWVDTMVQRTPDGKWVARGIVGEPLPTTSWERGEEDMLCWLASQGVRFGTSVQEFERTCSDLSSILSSPSSSAATSTASFPAFHPIATGSDYRSRIDSCREAIRQGESYELTLTTRFLATLNSTEPYDLYLRLRTFNPAYYSAYMSFPSLTTPRGNGIHVLSSSPERFLKIEGGQVEMMPIKGTRARVKPGHCVCTPETGCRGVDEGGEACVEEANREDEKRGRELQSDPKERAENLMVNDAAYHSCVLVD